MADYCPDSCLECLLYGLSSDLQELSSKEIGGFMNKSDLEISLQRQVVAASTVLDLILSSTGPSDLCRQVVHADFVPASTRGCEIFYVDGKSALKSVGSYGVTFWKELDLSAWDNSVLSEAVREKRVVGGPLEKDNSQYSVIAVPFVTHGVPVGLMAVVIEEADYQIKTLPESAELYLKLGAFYLESLDLGNTMSSIAGNIPAGPDDLTTRQLTILNHIQNGLVNLEISKELMLSESTIRQETVRIYRALGVGNRHEAAKKARALGIIGKKALTPEH